MKRWIACGLAAGWVAGGWAAEPLPAPVSVYPPTPAELPVIPPATTPAATQAPATPPPAVDKPPAAPAKAPAPAAGTPDVTKPLSSVLETPPAGLPLAAPAVMAADPGCVGCAADCGTGWRIPRIPRLGLGLGSSACGDRLRGYFGWQAGPRVIPTLTPTPYQPPLRHYFTGAPVTNVGAGCATTEKAPFFGPRLMGGLPCNPGGCSGGWVGGGVGGRVAAGIAGRAGGCADGGCGRGGRCDGCYESTLDKAVSCLTPRQFGRTQPNCWSYPGAPQVSACAAGGCNGVAGVAPAGGGIYPGITGGYRFASPVFVPPAPAVYASGTGVGVGGGVGLMSAGTGGAGAVGGNVGAVGTGTPGTGGGTGTGSSAGTSGAGTGGSGPGR